MEKTKKYKRVIFSADVIQEAIRVWSQVLSEGARIKSNLSVQSGSESWDYDTDEEFYADYRRGFSFVHLNKSADEEKDGEWIFYKITMFVHNYPAADLNLSSTEITISGNTRAEIEAVFEIFEKNVSNSMLPQAPAEKPVPPVIFIGHGQSQQWRDLKDHLHEKHDYRVEAYEIGARAGHAVRDILEDMMNKSSFAIFVLTGDDKDAEGKPRARQNVIHETGLFQGKLGFSKAIILLEDGVEEFSNISGIQQIRFSKGNIKETFGEILATLKREFEPKTT